MKLFGQYLNLHKKSLLLFTLFSAVFFVVFSLYRLPFSAVGYGVLLCIFIGFLLMIRDFRAFLRKHKELETLLPNVTFTLDYLPLATNLIEADYQNLIRAMFSDKAALLSESSSSYSLMVDYYSMWAHQIKTPIAAMRLLLQCEDTPENKELMDELFKIEQYVEMVLCYLRLDSVSSDYVIREYDLDNIIRQAVRKYAPRFIRKKIKLEYDNVNCKVLSDEKWLLFVIEQVLSNSLKYTDYGTIQICLEAPKILCLRDTGIGIAPEDLPRIFEKGFTGYNGRADKKSTGIGLYLCRRIADRLGHRIIVTSEVGKGTLVRINLDSAVLEVE